MQSLEVHPTVATPTHRAAAGPDTPRLLAIVADGEALEVLQTAVAGQRLELVAEVSAERALQRLAAERFEIVICEWGSERFDGPSLLADARRRKPETVRLLIAPTTEMPDLMTAIIDAGIFRLLSRPLQLAELRRSLDEALAYHGQLRDKAITRRLAP